MDCKELRELVSDLETDSLSPEVLQHQNKCPSCQRLLRDARLVKAGFMALSREPVPEPSIGFASRAIRRFEEWQENQLRSEFVETVGRRFVYATSALVLALLLVLVLPLSGPFRSVSSTDISALQSEVRPQRFEVTGRDVVDFQDLVPEGRSK